MKTLYLGIFVVAALGAAEAPVVAQPGSTPYLKITAGQNAAIVDWPTNATGFILETASSLNAPVNWKAATNNFAVAGTNLEITVPGPNAPVFYRLHWISPGSSAIVAPAKTWTWVTFTNAYCMGGTPLGIGVNLNTNSSNLLIFLTGGGACWDETTCYVLDNATQGPFGQAQFNALVPGLQLAWICNRAAPDNPFKDYSFVYVPYCTGDVHSGSQIELYGTNVTMHVGYLNMAAYLRRLVPTLPGVQHVVLAGSSAGGFGAVFNWAQTQKAFGNARVDVIDDSGPILPASVQQEGYGVFLPTGEASLHWDVNASLPSACASCPTDYETLYDYVATAAPAHRSALLSYTQDTTIPQFYGITASEFLTGINDLGASDFAPYTNTAYFFYNGSGHTFFLSTSANETQNGVTLSKFLNEMVTNSAAWTSEHP